MTQRPEEVCRESEPVGSGLQPGQMLSLPADLSQPGDTRRSL